MDAMLSKKAEELAKELAGSATTLNELSEVMRSLMQTALERMLNTEMVVHLGGNKSDVEKSQGDDLQGEGPSISKNRRGDANRVFRWPRRSHSQRVWTGCRAHDVRRDWREFLSGGKHGGGKHGGGKHGDTRKRRDKPDWSWE